MGLVRISASPARRCRLSTRSAPRSAKPLIAKPSASSGASPGMSAGQRRAGFAQGSVRPQQELAEQVLGLLRRPEGHAGQRQRGLRFGAHGRKCRRARDWRQCARRRTGRATMAGKKGRRTAPAPCREGPPRGRRRPAHPFRSERRGAGNGSMSASTRSSTLAPSFDPQPLQRIAKAERLRGDSWPAAASDASAAPASSIAGRSLNLAMKRRSIQSFQVQTHLPATDHPPREPTARLSPVLIRLRNFFCGRNGRGAAPWRTRRRFRSSGGPLAHRENPRPFRVRG